MGKGGDKRRRKRGWVWGDKSSKSLTFIPKCTVIEMVAELNHRLGIISHDIF